MSAIRFGVIGCGTMGTALATQVGKAGPPAVVSAVCDILPDPRERLSADLGCDAVASAPELLTRDDLDAVIVATPNYLHREHVLAVAAAGKHVFCEKPMALTVEDCTAMIDACRDAGVKLMVGQVLRYIGPYPLIRQVVAEGRIGELRGMAITRIGGPWHGDGVAEWRRGLETCGGLLFEVNIHELDYQRTLLGDPVEVYAASTRTAEIADTQFDDLYSVTIRFPNGCVGQLLAGNCYDAGVYRGQVYGSKGTITFDGWGGIDVQRFGEETEHIDPTPDAGDPVGQELGDFVSALVDGTPVRIPGEEGRASVALCVAAEQSARTAKAVRLG